MKTTASIRLSLLFTVSILIFISCDISRNKQCNAYGTSSSGGSQVAYKSNGIRGHQMVRSGDYNYGFNTDAYYSSKGLNELSPTDSIQGLVVNSQVLQKDVPDVASQYERYASFTENDWVNSSDEIKSTFSIDVDNAAYTNFRRFVNQGQLPPKDAIRIEEWLNFFNYELEAPKETDPHPLKIATEIQPCPWNESDDLLMVKLQGKKPIEENLPPSNLVFLVDVSGSMNSPNKLPLAQSSMTKLANKLRPEDRMSIVTYAGASNIVLEPTSGAEKKKIIEAVNSLTSGGGTAGSKGLETAYELAMQYFDEDGNNRIIVASDGDWNIGTTSTPNVKKLIEKKRETGIFLSVLGFGMYNLNDELMESMADNGNGNYAYIDSEKEATRIFDTEFSGSMYTIAKDVKLQLEFDSDVVEKYRLIGYENRVLENWQFDNDTIDAGDLGMGQNVVAFYQISRKAGKKNAPLGKVDFRYKPLKSDVSTLLSHPMRSSSEETTTDFKFASCVVEFAMCLRESEYRGDANMARAILRGKQNLGDPNAKLSYEKRVEFVGLMEEVNEMWGGYVFEEAPKITEDKAPSLKLYPNPTSEQTTVEVPEELSHEWSVQVFSMSGALKKVQHFSRTTTGVINVQDLAPEVYMVKVYGGGYNYGYLRLVVK
ncbi:MAG: von Willebrand factor type A domain-containing protein [bacterium]|nr:von Willebrand factor type A domain-containing protein [bacterium]